MADSIQAIGYIARVVPESTQQCLTALMSFIQSKYGSFQSHVTAKVYTDLNSTDIIVTNAVLVLKSLVQIRLQQQQDAIVYGMLPSTFSPLDIISRLARRLDEIRHPKARACVVWLVGQYAASPIAPQDVNGLAHAGPEVVTPWAPDVLRKVAKSFAEEVRTCHFAPAPSLPSLTRGGSDACCEAAGRHARR